jgi:hypothetical protein
MNTATTQMTPFAIRTQDTAWIKRNNATVHPDGWVFFDVPLAKVGKMTFCRVDHLRYTLPDLPRDFGNKHACVPAVHVPETAALVGASTHLPADVLARKAETAAWKAANA